MKRKVLAFLFIGTLIICLAFISTVPNSSRSNPTTVNNSQEPQTRRALTQNLISKSGETILEFIEASYQTTGNSWDNSSCRVKNLSGKTITALGLIWTVIFSNGEQVEIEQLIDSRVHKDIAELKKPKPFAPNNEKVIQRSVKESFDEGQSINSVKVEVDFVEFDDSDGVGIDKSEMYKHLVLQREGAEMYKKWVADIYAGDSTKVEKILEKLSTDELPNDKKLEDERIKRGASIYKQWLLGVYNEKGVNGLRQVLRGK